MFRDEVSPIGDGGRDDYPSVSASLDSSPDKGSSFFTVRAHLYTTDTSAAIPACVGTCAFRCRFLLPVDWIV